jgi:antirestriction protein ArdC
MAVPQTPARGTLQMAFDLYQNVTARILSELETGTAPWVKPWSATPGHNVPSNAKTGVGYRGCNIVLLWMVSHRFTSPRFVTYVQAKEMGGHVKKDEHGFQIVKVITGIDKKRKNADGSDATYQSMKYFTVFNVDQCEGLNLAAVEPVKSNNPDERDATIEEFIAASGADYREGKGGDRAFYATAGDFVAMPAFEAFKSAASYYGTAFHELGHWTGNAKRLNREFGKRFGDKAYAAEELVAELTAAFLCAEFNVNGELRHAGYIQNWITLLKEDNKAFFTAASAAQKAADYLRQAVLANELPLAA